MSYEIETGASGSLLSLTAKTLTSAMANLPRWLGGRRHMWLGIVLVLRVSSVAQEPAPAEMSRAQLVASFQEGRAKLNALYWSPALGIWLDRPGDDLRGHYEGRRNPPWWPSANAVEVLIDFMTATGTRDDLPTMEALYALQKDRPAREERVVAELRRRGQWNDADEKARAARLAPAPAPEATPARYYTDFQNEYLDDSGWWALAWLKMHALTGDEKYLTTARVIHAHMARNWNPAEGGGISWCEEPDRRRPNAITNNLFLLLSARLYRVTGEPPFLEWAEKTLAWIHEKKLYDGIAMVDAPGHHGDYWSYNQGTYLGGLTALSEATGRSEYLEEAAVFAESLLHRSGLVREDGVIVEKLGTGGDAPLFKGIFARYLAHFREVAQGCHVHPELVREIDHILPTSAASLLRNGMSADGLYTVSWHAGAGKHETNFNAQVAGLALLGACLH